MTIQERAKECYPPEIMCDGGSGERGYVKGATDQQAIDIDKASEWLLGYFRDTMTPQEFEEFHGKFRKAMTEFDK